MAHLIGDRLIPLASSFEFSLVGFYMWAPLKVYLVAGFPLRVAMVCDIFLEQVWNLLFGFLGGLLQETQQPKLCFFFWGGG